MSTGDEKNFSLAASRLKEERQRLRLSQQAAGRMCGVSREVWGRYERGQVVPGGEVLFAFAAAGADVQYILTGVRAVPAAVAGVEDRPGMSPREQALLENYRESEEEDRRAIERMALRSAEAQHNEHE